MLCVISRFRSACEGTVLVFFAVSLAVFLGFVALSFDLGRVASTQSELQSFTDNVALAAAGELDGGADALQRARAAAAELITDSHTFGEGERTLSGADDLSDDVDYTLAFYATLPTDTTALTATSAPPLDELDPDSNAAANFVRAVVTVRTVDMSVAAAFRALTGNEHADASVGAEAVAGFTRYACDVTPLMFCMPGPDFRADEHIGEMMKLRSGGSSGSWGPGNFGFVDLSTAAIDDLGPCEGLSNVQLTACLLGAQDYLTQCFSQRGIDTKPGQNVGNLETAVNVRFDIYEATMRSERNQAAFAPAVNVVKGTRQDGGQCRLAASTDTVALPRDDCFAAGTCANFGDGNYDWTEYVATNHGTDSSTTPQYPPGTDASSTRYQMYLAEIAAAGTDVTVPILDGRSETGRPHCATTTPYQNPDRRVVIAAGVNCDPANGGTEVNGAANNVPVQEFVKLFLTEPAGADPSDSSKFDIYAEIVGSASSGPGGVIRDVVQLYR